MQFLKAMIAMLLTSMLQGLPAAYASEKTAYDFSFNSIDGTPMPLSQFRGKTLLIVNTASKCGFTGQYDGLQKLYEEYRKRGLVVIAVPSNDFGNQEPGKAADIQSFCKAKFNVTFPITDKYVVSGEGAHPLFKWLAETMGKNSTPKWNFYKYLINSEGKPVNWYISKTDPLADRLIKAIDESLPPQFSLPQTE